MGHGSGIARWTKGINRLLCMSSMAKDIVVRSMLNFVEMCLNVLLSMLSR